MRLSLLAVAIAALLVSGVAAKALQEPGRQLQEQRSSKISSTSDKEDGEVSSKEEKTKIPTREERCKDAISAHMFAVQALGLDSSLDEPEGMTDDLRALMEQVRHH